MQEVIENESQNDSDFVYNNDDNCVDVHKDFSSYIWDEMWLSSCIWVEKTCHNPVGATRQEFLKATM